MASDLESPPPTLVSRFIGGFRRDESHS
jgi:hypothetical protein